jgi:hypothetical protein
MLKECIDEKKKSFEADYLNKEMLDLLRKIDVAVEEAINDINEKNSFPNELMKNQVTDYLRLGYWLKCQNRMTQTLIENPTELIV